MSEQSRAGRFLRYSGIVNPAALINSHILIVGVGAIGRQVALQLAAMGTGSIELCDMDTVEEANLGAQGYRPDQLGLSKVGATRHDIEAINSDGQYYDHHCRFDSDFFVGDYTHVFICVDCMTARNQIAESCVVEGVSFTDTRMSGLNAQAYYVDRFNDGYAKYASTLFTNEQAHPEPCTARSVIFTSNIIAGIAISLWASSLRQTPDFPYLRLSLADYTIDSIQLESEAAPPQETLPSEDAVQAGLPSGSLADPATS